MRKSLEKRNETARFCPICGSDLVSGEIDGVARNVCSSDKCGFVLWNNPVPVVAALVECNNQYIVARNRSWPKGIFSVITGYLEQDESPEEAVIREVQEELGLQGTIRRFIGNYAFRESNQVLLCYEVTATGKITTNHELAEVTLLSPQELSAYDFHPLYITEKLIKDWKILNGFPMEKK